MNLRDIKKALSEYAFDPRVGAIQFAAMAEDRYLELRIQEEVMKGNYDDAVPFIVLLRLRKRTGRPDKGRPKEAGVDVGKSKRSPRIPGLVPDPFPVRGKTRRSKETFPLHQGSEETVPGTGSKRDIDLGVDK